ncbi:MAG: hypothetical protein MZV70_75185 [Desulfobacterales bacterium]|nr:hypothetical protein [Desulfobacterales bacterium]
MHIECGHEHSQLLRRADRALLLVLLRVSTIVVMIPILGERTTPARVKGGWQF